MSQDSHSIDYYCATCDVFYAYAGEHDKCMERKKDVMEEKKAFKPGDVVVLKSGSPPMTVESIDANRIDTVTCVMWVEHALEFNERKFAPIMLEFANESTGAA